MQTKPILAVLLIALGAAAAPLTQRERERLVAHLEMTGSWLASEVSGLSESQLRFRPAPGAWNVLEVLDHLVVSGPIYWQDFERAMAAPPGAAPRSGSDESFLWYGIDRTQRGTAVSKEEPRGQLRDVRAGLEILRKLEARMIEYVKTTQADLRGHVVEREHSDAYQWLLLISAHQQRHILQIREIKADPKFPKK